MRATVYTNKEIWKIAYPCLVSLVMEQMIGVTDTAFLGHVGEVELGASALAGVYYVVIFMLGFGFSTGAQIIMARRNGEQEYRHMGRLFYHGIYFLMVLAAVAFALTTAFTEPILGSMISDPEILDAACDYMQWRIYGLFFAFPAAMFRAFYISSTQTKTLTLNSVVMVLSNVVFNYILIFGKLGVPAMGIGGAALGSSLSEMVSLIFFIVYTSRRIDCRKYGLDRLSPFHFATLKKIFPVSFWTMIQSFISLSTWFLFFLFIEHLGKEALAITNVIRSISGLLFMVVAAFAATCSSLVSNLIGAGKTDSVMPTIWQHVRLAFCLVLPVALLLSLFPGLILGIYTDIPNVRAGAVASLWVLCSSYLFTVPAQVLFQSISGTGNTRTAFLLELSTLAVYVAYCAVIIGWLRLDVAVCWTAEHVYSAIITLLCAAYLYSGRWKGKRI